MVSSVLDRRLVKVTTIIQTDTQDNSQLMPPPAQFLPFPQYSLLPRHQLLGRQIPTLRMGATRTIFKCGMQPWQHNSNKVAKVKVSNDKTR